MHGLPSWQRRWSSNAGTSISVVALEALEVFGSVMAEQDDHGATDNGPHQRTLDQAHTEPYQHMVGEQPHQQPKPGCTHHSEGEDDQLGHEIAEAVLQAVVLCGVRQSGRIVSSHGFLSPRKQSDADHLHVHVEVQLHINAFATQHEYLLCLMSNPLKPQKV